MCPRKFAWLFALTPAVLFGQLDSHTVTVAASQGGGTPQNQAVFSVSVGSRFDQGLDEVVRAIAGSGLTAANLSGISSPGLLTVNTQIPQLSWGFQLMVPLAQTKSTIASLSSLQKTIGQNATGMSMSFALQSTQIPSQNCDLAALVADARNRAQKLAAVAGFPVGAITGISTSTSTAGPDCSLSVTFALGYSGNPGPHTITINASQANNQRPDQVAILLDVSSDLTFDISDVTRALADAGLTGAIFSGLGSVTIYGPKGPQQVLDWSFSLSAPLVALKDTLAQILNAQSALPKQNSSLSLRFYIGGLQVSPQAQQACSQADVVSAAQAQAQRVAAAASLSSGAILSMSTASPGAGSPIAAARSGFASFILGALDFSLTIPDSCSLTVQFQLN